MALIQLDRDISSYITELAIRLGLFFITVVIAPALGRSLTYLIRLVLQITLRRIEVDTDDTFDRFIKPFQNYITTTGTLLFIALSLNLLVKYPELYTFLGFFVYMALSISLALLASKIVQRVIRQVAIDRLRRRGQEINEIILVFETVTNIIIILIAVIIFAQGLNLNLFALSASLGIGGVAVAFASRQALERLVGTFELYLDRPYVPGEYVRVNFNPFAEDVYGRIESIGLRSTKIRTAAQNTLVIVPNSMMAGMKIENVTRGKKVMAIVCLDFYKLLSESEKALVQQAIEDISESFWGIERGSTRVHFSQIPKKLRSRVRLSFFISGSSQDSLNLRKRLLELANEEIANNLTNYNLAFSVPESMVYLDSPMSI
ncbi:mechanosensitive ion channel family protein [Baaleninema sp.]|uniref:mechanosensitive ion channel family protein n=1 Tax=Baaleninema sp. TaxID=3101197 RepID=UPI003CFD06EA